MNTNSPLVSVLIPAYNHENYVQETIKSIINQTYKNIELIIVDDGSKDFTWQKIQELKEVCEARFARVHFETKQNEGTCNTMNKLLSYAQGEFIYLIASDDVAKPQAIEKEATFLVKNPDYALCVGDNEFIDADGKICYQNKDRDIVYDKESAKFKSFSEFLKTRAHFDLKSNKFGRYDTLFRENHVPNGYLIRKSIFEKIGYFTKEAPLEDWWLMLQTSKYAKLKYLDEVLFSYRWHNANTIKQADKMNELNTKTRAYEWKALENTNLDELPVFTRNIVAKYKNEGVTTSKIGIPFVITFEKYKKGTQKIRKIKLFNCTVFQWEK